MENNPIEPGIEGTQDLLSMEMHEFDQFVYASQGQRFLNWLIDNLLMRFGLSYLTGMLIGLILVEVAPSFIQEVAYSGGSFSGSVFLLTAIIGYFNYLVYYTLCEKLLKGRTLGKLITGTRAIRQDGRELTFKNAFLRSLSRLVPFEIFSGFSTLTWHDSWTDTMVVKAK
jgi:uncharacterized RDD family membrane protein YckC